MRVGYPPQYNYYECLLILKGNCKHWKQQLETENENGNLMQKNLPPSKDHLCTETTLNFVQRPLKF